MGDFVLIGAIKDSAGHEMASRLRTVATSRGLSPVNVAASAWFVCEGPQPLQQRQVGAWTLLGRVIDRKRAPIRRTSDADPHAYEKKLLARFWGGYVGVRFDTSGLPAAVLRDPSGALDCAAWGDGGLVVIASHLPDWLISTLRPDWEIAYERVHAALHDPLSALGELLLDGPRSILPGTVQPLPHGDPIVLWRPDGIAREGERTLTGDDEAACRLVEAIDEAVGALGRQAFSLAAEVSGGLDSSLVAASLSAGKLDVRLWLNAFGRDAASDEREYVAALGDYLRIEPSSHPRAEGVVTTHYLRTMPQGMRPPFAALDGLHDADWARRLRAAGSTALMTGKGGDGLLIQPASAAVFSDLWRSRGWRSLLSPALPALARWNERSVWSLIAEARGRDVRRPPDGDNHLVTPLSNSTGHLHPWLRSIGDLGPGKRMQILSVVHGVGLHGPSLQTAVVDVLHPLLSTPVVETCLALPTIQLTLGRRDRALARKAFADRLPAKILERRSKGEMTAFYGRMIEGGLDVLRPWILEGHLARRGLIDRAEAEDLLTPESLIWRGGYADLMMVAAIEGWVRAWEARLSPAA